MVAPRTRHPLLLPGGPRRRQTDDPLPRRKERPLGTGRGPDDGRNTRSSTPRVFIPLGRERPTSTRCCPAAKEHGYPALALTDTNLCGALEFARLANDLGIRPITGGELTLTDGSRLTLLAQTRAGYSNISRLFTLANDVDRRNPRLDPTYLSHHSEGVVLLTGGRDGSLSRLAMEDRIGEASGLLKQYLDWFGSGSVYVELQQNLLQGDTDRNRKLTGIARDTGVPVVATNDVHYHSPERSRLQDALVAASLNVTIDQALPHLKPNHHLYLKSPAQMKRLFSEMPEAISNTLQVAERCHFNLSTDLGYTLPEPAVPQGYTAESYLHRLCYEAAARRYGGSVSQRVDDRLREEFRLIRHLNLAGFLLLYREIALLAQRIMEERGLVDPETPMEERPPGRGRGSSVALLVGYLIGISHVDPLMWDLTLERFISEDMTTLPDIDLDFPRGLRDELIQRVHRHFGPEYAVLTGAITTYKVKGIIQDLGKALGLPREHLSLLSRRLHSHNADELREEMLRLPDFRDRVDTPGWRDLLDLAPHLMNAPRGLSQHVGGMVLSSSPMPEMVPMRAGAMEGRFIMDWNKDSVADAGFAKIDLLSLPVLDQLEEALDLIEKREGKRPDLGRIDPKDPNVYDMINEGRAKGVFLLQSPAQLKMAQRLRSRNLLDLAYQVALIRPGVGVQGSAVSQFVERYRHGAQWEYDHPLEKRALERGCGIIVWQEQVVQLIQDVGGMTAAQADQVTKRLRPPQQRPSHRHVPEKIPAGRRRQRRAGGRGPEDLRQDQWPLHVPRVPLPRLRCHRLPGRVAQAIPSPGVLRHPDEQPAHGILSRGDSEAGRQTLRRALPQPLREPQRRQVHPPPGRSPGRPVYGEGRGRGIGKAPSRGEGAARTLCHCRRPGAADGAEAPGRAVPSHGRSLRRYHVQPQGGPLGGGAVCPAPSEWPGHPSRLHGGQRTQAGRLHPL